MSSANFTVRTIMPAFAQETLNYHRCLNIPMEVYLSGLKWTAFCVFASRRKFNWYRKNPDNISHLEGSTLYRIIPHVVVTAEWLSELHKPLSKLGDVWHTDQAA